MERQVDGGWVDKKWIDQMTDVFLTDEDGRSERRMEKDKQHTLPVNIP